MKISSYEEGLDLASINVMLCKNVWTGSHHTEDDSFLESVRGRCYICYPVLQACPRKTRDYAVYFRTFFEIESCGSARYSMRVTIELRQLSASIEAQVIELHGKFKILPKTDVLSLDLERHLPTGTFDAKCQLQVHDWLTSCCESHVPCNEDWRTTLDFPMRLLKVVPTNRIMLKEYGPGDMRPPYVTMSHCWDAFSGALVLTSSNLSDFKEGFSGSRLPRKFQDAVAIARWMGVDYLWIDALCINQDSPDDWQRQSKVMGDIYAGSLCNIAATNEGLDSSCFRQRPVDLVEPFCVPDPTQSSAIETHVIGYDDFWCNSLLDAKLHTRAWVLQERLLAPRTVHFGKEQIYWECRVSKACEAYPEGIPEQFLNHRTRAWREGEQIFNPGSRTTEQGNGMFIPTRTRRGSASSIAISSSDAQSFWSRTVERYMGCDMTYASDKLVAIAGLARKMQETTKEPYLAGLWRNESLPQSLLWFVPASKQTDGRQSIRYPSLGARDYRAPSWSWASIDGSITWICPARCDRTLIDITGVHATPAGENPVGAVLSAAIFMKAVLVPIRIDIVNRHEDGTLNEDGTYMVTHRLEGVATNDDNNSPSATKQGVELQPLIYLDTDLSTGLPTGLPTVDGVDAYVIPICTQWQGRTGRIIAAVAGLLVRNAPLSEGQATFERFGIIGFEQDEAQLLFGSEPSTKSSFGLLEAPTTDFVLV